MIRTTFISICFLVCSSSSRSQLCPGGGVNFNSAVLFDPAWIYGCATGTSCNGGVALDNRFSCEPVTAMDTCAPQPSCGTIANNASDIWFKFYPTYSVVTLASVQNTSFVIGIQAFDGNTCGSLTEIGCALASGPSSGVQLTLTGLQTGQLYYFRIFGSSNSIPQRTGLYCFCGTTGVQATILPLSMETLKGVVRDNKVALSFQKPSPDDKGIYEIEYSADGVSFQPVYRITNRDMASDNRNIVYTHSPVMSGSGYYRLKYSTDGSYHYSSVLKISLQIRTFLISHNNAKAEITIEAFKKTTLSISDISGRSMKSMALAPGLHRVSTATLSSGIYIVHNSEDNKAYKFILSK